MGRHHYSLQISFCFCYHSNFSQIFIKKKFHGLTFNLSSYGLDKFSPVNELNKYTYLLLWIKSQCLAHKLSTLKPVAILPVFLKGKFGSHQFWGYLALLLSSSCQVPLKRSYPNHSNYTTMPAGEFSSRVYLSERVSDMESDGFGEENL